VSIGATSIVRTACAVVLLGAVHGAALAKASKAAPETHKPPVTLSVWIMPNGSGDNLDNFDALVRPFIDANPDVKVETTVIPWNDALGRIQAAVNGAPAPDVVQLGTTWVASIASTGRLLDLSKAYDQKLFPPAVLATTEIEGSRGQAGRRFAMPWIVDTRALYYNKAICVAAGVDPTRDFATWDSFRAALQKMKQVGWSGKHPEPLGIPMTNWDIIHNLSWWIWGAGGGFVSRHPNEPGINAPASLAGIEYYIGLYRDGLVSPAADRGDAVSVAEMLRKGDIAVTIAFPIPSLPEDRFGATLIPAGSKGRFTFLGGSALGVFRSTKHPKQAIRLLRYLSTEAAQVRYAATTGLLPAAAAQYDELLLKLDPIRGVFVRQMQYGRAYPSIPQWGDIELVLRDGLNAVWAFGRAPSRYDGPVVRTKLDQMAKQIDAIMRRARVRELP
jgi:multiple sugar transport system substrate-binding protein